MPRIPYPTLEATAYLVFRHKSYGDLGVRLAHRTPSLDSGEVAVEVTFRLPSALFEKPQLRATIEVPADKVSPTVIDASVLDNIQQVMQQQLGMEISLAVIEPAQGEAR